MSLLAHLFCKEYVSCLVCLLPTCTLYTVREGCLKCCKFKFITACAVCVMYTHVQSCLYIMMSTLRQQYASDQVKYYESFYVSYTYIYCEAFPVFVFSKTELFTVIILYMNMLIWYAGYRGFESHPSKHVFLENCIYM